GDASGEGKALPTRGTDQGRRLLKEARPAPGHSDAAAAKPQLAGELPADAGRGARDEDSSAPRRLYVPLPGRSLAHAVAMRQDSGSPGPLASSAGVGRSVRGGSSEPRAERVVAKSYPSRGGVPPRPRPCTCAPVSLSPPTNRRPYGDGAVTRG